jgi:hypothetical protein
MVVITGPHAPRMLLLSSNREPMEPPVDGYRQLVRMDVIHPIPVPFMDKRELRKGRIAQRSAVDL